MFRHYTNTAWFFSVLIAAFIFSLSLAGVAAAQGNTSLGTGALQHMARSTHGASTGQRRSHSPSWPAASRCAFTVVTLLCFGYAPYHMCPDRGDVHNAHHCRGDKLALSRS